MAVLQRAPLTGIIADWVQDRVGRPIGRLQSPVDRPFPYGVMYVIPGGGFDGPPLTGPDEDATLVYQFNSVDLSPDGAEALADSIRAVILDRVQGAFAHPAPYILGWSIMDRRPDGGPADVSYNGAPPKRVFTAAERFAFVVTPS